MNFFESQDRARRKTGQLVFLFGLATLSLVAITNLFLIAVGGGFGPDNAVDAASLKSHLLISLGVVVVIAVASLYKIARLSGGGEVVAQSLGGKLLNQNTTDNDERRVLNVVEEMALAAGLPVPPVYILDDDALNAFAAGFHSDDAVIGLTRGCVRFLNREELQGVIAHEFSHILHGDMRINIRLIGVLYGILVVGHIGYFIMRSSSFRSSRSNRDGAPLILIGVGLVVIGSIGTFFGNLIKASVSRQREYLADASAVQYTRNPNGIGNALRKIGGLSIGSRLVSPNAAEASHMLIAQGLKLSSLMATHPPLEDRISRLVPDWDGSFIDSESEFRSMQSERAREKHFGAGVSQFDSGSVQPDISFSDAGAAQSAVATSVLDSVGDIRQDHLDYAGTMLETLRGEILSAVHNAEGARAAIYCLLLSKDTDVLGKQLEQIAEYEGPEQKDRVKSLHDAICDLGVEYRIPIVDLCMPTLKRQYEDQHRDFRKCVLALMRADEHIDLFEWCLHRVFVRHLDSIYMTTRRSKVRYKKLEEISQQCETICAALASCAGENQQASEQAFAEAMAELGFDTPASLRLPPLAEIDSALADVCAVAPLEKPRLIKACARSVLADGEVSAEEYELLRAVADSIDVPMPPRLAQQALL
ncbi:MAG: M48 family metallopeptidase [Pseudomonadales bacterium]